MEHEGKRKLISPCDDLEAAKRIVKALRWPKGFGAIAVGPNGEAHRIL